MGASGTDSKPAPVIPILIAMVAGAFTGWLLGADAAIGSVKLLPVFDLLGSMFINLLPLSVIPELRLTDKGLIDVVRMRVVPLFEPV